MTALANYDAARTALAAAHGIDEVKEIRDKAEAMRAYARLAGDTQMQRWMAEIKLRAERRAGDLLAEMAASGARHSGHGDQKTESQAATPKLKDLGISRDQASRWQACAALPQADFEAWLAAHTGDKMPSSSGLRNLVKIRAAKATATGQVTTLGGEIADLDALAVDWPHAYGVIYVDPPWRFETYSGAGKARAAETHYPTLDMQTLSAMWPDVQALAAPDCALFLWVVAPLLPDALHLIEDWGFTYKTVAFTWVKENPSGAGFHKGMGYWTRANPEICLLATRGAPTRLARDVDQLVIAPRGAHSAKPEEVPARIERLVAGPYLELFARRERSGWTVWGNEVPRAGLAGGGAQTKESVGEPAGAAP